MGTDGCIAPPPTHTLSLWGHGVCVCECIERICAALAWRELRRRFIFIVTESDDDSFQQKENGGREATQWRPPVKPREVQKKT